MRFAKAETESPLQSCRWLRGPVGIAALLTLAGCAEDVNTGPLAPTRLSAVTATATTTDLSNAFGVSSKPSKGENAGVVVAMRRMRSAPTDSLSKWRNALDRFAKVSRRKDASVALSRIILDAVSAPTDAEYHSKIAQLPVVITDSAGFDAVGRAGVYRNYAIYGKTRISWFRPTQGETDGAPAVESALEGDAAEPGLTEDETVTAPAFTWCIDDFPEGYWEGECATQQEIDDANATLSALEEEMDGVEVDVAHAEYCAAHPEDYQTCADQHHETGADSTPAAEWLEGDSEATDDVALWVASEDCIADNIDSNFRLSRELYANGTDCTMQGALFAIAAGAWYGVKSMARSVLGKATTSNTVGWTIFGAMTAGFALAGGAGYFIECLQS